MSNLKEVIYYKGSKKHKVKARVCESFFSKGIGLTFKNKSPPLFFVFRKEMKITITSIFCKPFKAIWLDKNFRVTKIVDVKTWKWGISGQGKYLIEIPIAPKK